MRVFSRVIVLLCIVGLQVQVMSGQNEEVKASKGLDFCIEVQAYPTGIIPGFRTEYYLNKQSSINLRLGYQWIDHRDLGVQDVEVGSGVGASLAYRRFFGYDYTGLSLAFRTDLWFNVIDWETGMETGTTNITVIQPTLMGEYAFRSDRNLIITPSLSFGWEWNAATDGQPTGEGAIVLIGCTFGFGI